jgi:NADH-quinone oxidoreductase subunit E
MEDSDEIRQLIAPYRGKRGVLIQILQEIQNNYGYVSHDAISAISEETEIAESEIYGVASFYSQFKFKKIGLHQIKVCLGTSCHVSGGENIMGSVERHLGIRYGSTTDDDKFSLERVACMGCCGLSPVIVIDGIVYGKVEHKKLAKLLNKLSKVEDDKQNTKQ